MKKLVIPIIAVLALVLVGLFYLKKPSSITGKAEEISLKSKSQNTIASSEMPKQLVRLKEELKVYPERLEVGDLVMPLLFDGNVNDSLKQLILKDLDLLYSHSKYKSYNWAEINPKLIKDILLDEVTYTSSKGLSFTNAYAPKSIRKHIGTVITHEKIEKILIPSEITEAYEKAYKVKQQHLPEYEELADFVYMITEANEEVPIPLHPRDFLYMPDAPVMKKIEDDPSLVPKAQKFYSKTTRLRMPSILEFSEASEDLQKKGITLYAKGYTFKGDSNVPSTATALVYHNGLWKIYGSDGGG